MTVASKCCARVGQHLDIIVLIHSTLSKSGYNAHDGKISAKGIPDKSNSGRFPETLSAPFVALKAVSNASYNTYDNGINNQETLPMFKNDDNKGNDDNTFSPFMKHSWFILNHSFFRVDWILWMEN